MIKVANNLQRMLLKMASGHVPNEVAYPGSLDTLMAQGQHPQSVLPAPVPPRKLVYAEPRVPSQKPAPEPKVPPRKLVYAEPRKSK